MTVAAGYVLNMAPVDWLLFGVIAVLAVVLILALRLIATEHHQ